MKVKIATLRSDSVQGCPFGLTPINTVCTHAGNSVLQMQPLADVPKEQREKYARANRKVYTAEMTGERCPFADKLPENHEDFVVCDYGDTAAGERDTPLRGSPFYPRVFNGISGAGSAGWGQWGLYSIPLGNYTNNSDAQQIFSGMAPLYGEAGVEPYPIEKTSLYQEPPFIPEENPILSTNSPALYYEFENSVLTEETHGN